MVWKQRLSLVVIGYVGLALAIFIPACESTPCSYDTVSRMLARTDAGYAFFIAWMLAMLWLLRGLIPDVHGAVRVLLWLTAACALAMACVRARGATLPYHQGLAVATFVLGTIVLLGLNASKFALTIAVICGVLMWALSAGYVFEYPLIAAVIYATSTVDQPQGTRLPWFITLDWLPMIPWIFTIAAVQTTWFAMQDRTGVVLYPENLVFSRERARDGELWTFLTYAFLHASVMHLVGNVSVLVLVGLPMEVLDGARIVGVWALAVAVGALFHGLETDVGLVGGSAGVYGLLAAHFANLTLNWTDMPYRWVYLAMIIALAVPPIADYLTAPEWSMTSYSAHLGGAIGGLFGGFLLLIDFHKTPIDRVVRTSAVIIGGVIIAIAAVTLYV